MTGDAGDDAASVPTFGYDSWRSWHIGGHVNVEGLHGDEGSSNCDQRCSVIVFSSLFSAEYLQFSLASHILKFIGSMFCWVNPMSVSGVISNLYIN